jgi:glycosyltransferase involved in cell wall biosynthesis
VVVEAMAMETPVVATSVGGTAELVEHGRNGLLAPPREPLAWADAVERLLDDRELRDRIVESGRATARRFDRRAYVDAVVRAYREAMPLARRRPAQETGVA